jgi:DNA helicase II / ATP-dependent DNA helicase PcrA
VRRKPLPRYRIQRLLVHCEASPFAVALRPVLYEGELAQVARDTNDRLTMANVDPGTFHRVFEEAVHPLDDDKRRVVDEPPGATIHVAAGPGSGKTTTLVARIAKLVFVDGLPPSGIVATTFTKKAANELRSRILEYGFAVQEGLVDRLRAAGEETRADEFEDIDINQVWTGTTDSLCQELLTLCRPPGVQPPVLVDEFVTRTMIMQHGVWDQRRFRSKRLKELLAIATGRQPNQFFPSAMGGILGVVADRLAHDQVDWELYDASHSPAEVVHRSRLKDALDAYRAGMAGRGWIDYASLETQTLEWLQAGHLDAFLSALAAVVVDEYQDTNLLQESLYFAMAQGCEGALTVVGDDDQSLYRFRGATVELFTAFPDRAEDRFGRRVARHHLSTNYRSSATITSFVDAFGSLDRGYQAARMAGKPRLSPAVDARDGLPVLAMFRDSVDDLAHDMADLVQAVFAEGGYALPDGHGVIRAGSGGDFGDAALLSFSPQSGANNQFLPGKLREELRHRGIETFNPRGTKIATIDAIQRLGGLILLCLDPAGDIEQGVFIMDPVRRTVSAWRDCAQDELSARTDLRRYVTGWQRRHDDRRWPREFPMIELVYALAHHYPDLMNDAEGQLHLEAVLRQLSAAERIGGYRGRIFTDQTAHDRAGNTLSSGSVKQIIENLIVPLADGTVELNEELIEDFPHDRMPVLSIHQSKGLEFPLVFVDVGSRFANPGSYRSFRFPAEGEESHLMEDHFRVGSPLGVPDRAALDRAFDDLYRRYFVAFSRARDVLVLVGRQGVHPNADIQNVATGWTRGGHSAWAGSANPFLEI